MTQSNPEWDTFYKWSVEILVWLAFILTVVSVWTALDFSISAKCVLTALLSFIWAVILASIGGAEKRGNNP